MFKNLLPIDDRTGPSARRPRPWRNAALIAAGIVCAPFLFEGALVCYGQWNLVMGREVEVRTPLTDVVRQSLGEVRDDLSDNFKPSLQRVIIDPRIVLPGSAIMIFCAILLLRR